MIIGEIYNIRLRVWEQRLERDLFWGKLKHSKVPIYSREFKNHMHAHGRIHVQKRPEETLNFHL